MRAEDVVDSPVEELARPERPGRGRLGADRELSLAPKLRSRVVGGAVLTLLDCVLMDMPPALGQEARRSRQGNLRRSHYEYLSG